MKTKPQNDNYSAVVVVVCVCVGVGGGGVEREERTCIFSQMFV